MNLYRAATYAVRNPFKVRGFAKIWLLTPIPIFGSMWAMGYALLTLRRMLKGHGDRELPPPRPIGAYFWWASTARCSR